MHRIFHYVGPMTNSDGQETVNSAQHRAALAGKTNPHGRALMDMLKGWELYAKAFRTAYECSIGTDGVIGRYWAETGLSIKRLLDGEAGGLDCGSIAANITTLLQEEGFKTDGYTLLDTRGEG